jgi:hypothetical protein
MDEVRDHTSTLQKHEQARGRRQRYLYIALSCFGIGALVGMIFMGWSIFDKNSQISDFTSSSDCRSQVAANDRSATGEALDAFTDLLLNIADSAERDRITAYIERREPLWEEAHRANDRILEICSGQNPNPPPPFTRE